jgi:uncharacterized protein YjbI with pentapeptide repeats
LTQADLTYADLRDASLKLANLSDVALAHTDLRGANLESAVFDLSFTEHMLSNSAKFFLPDTQKSIPVNRNSSAYSNSLMI